MKELLNWVGIILIFVSVIVGGFLMIDINVIIGFVMTVSVLVISIIMFALSDIINNQEEIAKEIREQNSIIIKIGQEVKTQKVKLNKIAESIEKVEI